MNIRLNPAILLRALGATNVGRGKDESRPILCTTLFEPVADDSGKYRLITTDSYRLTVAEVSDDNADLSDFTESFMLGGNLADLLRALKAAAKVRTDLPALVKITVEDHVVSFLFPDESRIVLPKVEGTFPDYRQLIPEAFTRDDDRPLAYNPGFMADAGKAAMLFTGETAKRATTPVRFDYIDSQKPAMFSVRAGDIGTLDYLLMPVRVSS